MWVEYLLFESSSLTFFVEPRNGDFVRDCVRDVLMERRKHERGPHLSLELFLAISIG